MTGIEFVLGTAFGSVAATTLLYVRDRMNVRGPIVTTSRNQTVVNNGELVITAADSGSVSVYANDAAIVVTYKRKA